MYWSVEAKRYQDFARVESGRVAEMLREKRRFSDNPQVCEKIDRFVEMVNRAIRLALQVSERLEKEQFAPKSGAYGVAVPDCVSEEVPEKIETYRYKSRFDDDLEGAVPHREKRSKKY